MECITYRRTVFAGHNKQRGDNETSMRADKKKARSRDKLAELFGLETPTPPTGPSAIRLKEDRSREAEGVLAYIENPTRFTTIKCRRCAKDFMVNRSNVALCSDLCREHELADVGIEWRWDRSPEERWYYVYDGDKRNTEPLVIGPVATKMILDNSLGEPKKVVVAGVAASLDLNENSGNLNDEFLYGIDS